MFAALFVAVPLGLYALAFSYETFAAFRRLAKPSGYINATWEITHTLLVLALTNFTWLYSDAMVAVSHEAYWGLIIAAAAFVLRAIMYVYLFFASPDGKHPTASWVFALCHLAMIVGLIYAVIAAIHVLTTQHYAVNDQLLPYMWPTLLVSVIICVVPIFQSFRRT